MSTVATNSQSVEAKAAAPELSPVECVRRDHPGKTLLHLIADGRFVAILEAWPEELERQLAYANAFAAAPELLRTCRAIIAEIEGTFSEADLASGETLLGGFRDRLRLALAIGDRRQTHQPFIAPHVDGEGDDGGLNVHLIPKEPSAFISTASPDELEAERFDGQA